MDGFGHIAVFGSVFPCRQVAETGFHEKEEIGQLKIQVSYERNSYCSNRAWCSGTCIRCGTVPRLQEVCCLGRSPYPAGIRGSASGKLWRMRLSGLLRLCLCMRQGGREWQPERFELCSRRSGRYGAGGRYPGFEGFGRSPQGCRSALSGHMRCPSSRSGVRRRTFVQDPEHDRYGRDPVPVWLSGRGRLCRGMSLRRHQGKSRHTHCRGGREQVYRLRCLCQELSSRYHRIDTPGTQEPQGSGAL